MDKIIILKNKIKLLESAKAQALDHEKNFYNIMINETRTELIKILFNDITLQIISKRI